MILVRSSASVQPPGLIQSTFVGPAEPQIGSQTYRSISTSRWSKVRGRLIKICVICGWLVVLCQAQQDNLFTTWRPNSDTRGIHYVGNKACVECHKQQVKQLDTPMAQALEVAPDCRIITARGKLTFRNGPYTYNLAREGGQIVYSISDGKNTIIKPILYCFGQGHVGQTFV